MTDGIINLFKPDGITSHDAVMAVRKKFKNTKVGHTGTLDPMATGVLPICLGKATRITEYLLSNDKKYRCEMTLGIITDTQDIWGNVIERKQVNVDDEQIKNAVIHFLGSVEQIPPVYSALKLNGKKLYEYARQGKKVDIKPRHITIYAINVIRIQDLRVLFDVKCSKGTYIRTLCNDIGALLGCGATMSALQRTSSGRFEIEDSVSIEALDELLPDQYLYPMDYPLNHLGSVEVIHEKGFRKARNGCLLNKEDFVIHKNSDNVRVYYNEKFIAIGAYNHNLQTVKLKKVFV